MASLSALGPSSMEVISGPPVQPWRWESMHTCAACGVSSAARLPRWVSMLRGGHFRITEFSFCPGGKEPQEPPPGGALAEQLFGARERVNICAGIMRPHLHVKCNACGYQWLMATKSEAV